jgi:hypothetical protein
LKIQTEKFEVEVINASVWRNPSQDNSRQYSKDYLLGEDFQNAPHYGLTVISSDGSINRCSVLANAGSTMIRESSVAAADEQLFLAIGNLVCCFVIPSLALKWHQQVDMATCFSIYVSPDKKGIISHGEIYIAKVSFDGEIEWSVSGKDVFSEGFELFQDHIEVIDFNYEEYRIEISTGRISVKNGG